MPSSQFYFVAVFTAESAPSSISHSSSNTEAAQRAYVGTDDLLLTWAVMSLEANQHMLMVFSSGLPISYSYTGDLLLVWTTTLAGSDSFLSLLALPSFCPHSWTWFWVWSTSLGFCAVVPCLWRFGENMFPFQREFLEELWETSNTILTWLPQTKLHQAQLQWDQHCNCCP